MKPTTFLATIVLFISIASIIAYGDSGSINTAVDTPSADTLNLPTTLTEEEHDFLDKHWQTTIPLQGEIPEDYSDLESSLDPASCGLCHAEQYKDWQTTFHAHAMGPGILGQVIDMVGDDNAQAQICWSCHTPLAEQQNVLKDGDDWQTNALFDKTLQHSGLVCAGCHVRQHERLGPPRKDTPNEIGRIDDGHQPHNGFTATTAFSNSAFCAHCHQFQDNGFALNGKLLENTYNEWQESRYAKKGIHCQSCHMPGRRHVWRGIHDVEMTKSAITIDVEAPQHQHSLGELYESRITLTNTGAGHYFPTYVTPKVFVRAELLDANGHVISNSLQEAVIGRETTPNLSQELYDSRIAPDDHVTILYREALHGKPAQLKVSIVVEPDHFYERFYQLRLANMQAGRSADLLREALTNTQQSHFTLFEQSYPINVDFTTATLTSSGTHSASEPETKAEVAIDAHELYWNDDDIEWHGYDDGLALAKAQNKPVLLVFYADWCPTCHAYRPIFEDQRLVELSKEFIMVRVNIDEQAEINKAYIPEEEWEYVPRTFALSPDGRRMDKVYSKTKAPRYFLSADSPAEFLYTMQAALLNLQEKQATQ